MEKIAVLGGGNGACSLAADLASQGYQVNLADLPSFAEGMIPVIEKKGLSYTGAIGEGFARLNMAGFDVAEAVRDAWLILVSVPSFGQSAFFDALIPNLEDGQTVVLITGNMGTLELAGLLGEKEIRKRITLAETNTLPYGTRLNGPASVNVEYKTSVSLAAFPSKLTAEVIAAMKGMFEIHPAGDVVEMGLLNTNLLLHPVECIFNAGRIEFSKGDFYSHGEGYTPVVARFSVRMYREMKSIGRAIGIELDIWKIASEFFGVDYDPVMAKEIDEMDEDALARYFSEAVQASPLANIRGPGHLDYRYLTEDIPYGLVTAASLGDMVGVDAKLIKTLIYIASIINRRDHMKDGRTVERLGIAGMSPVQLARYLKEGSI